MCVTSQNSRTGPLPASSPIEAAYWKAAGNFTSFKRLVDRRYRHAPHLAALDAALIEVTRYIESGGAQGLGRVIVEMPPRHGKSLSVSRRFPPWFLGRNPDKRVMMVSYSASLAEKHSRAARNLMRSPFYQGVFPGVKLADDSRAVDSWDIGGHEGGVDALGVGGSATGKGADLLDLDDAVKSRAEAESAVFRDKTWDWFTDDLYTRLEPGAAVVMTMTRWHEDDLAGRCLAQMPGVWKVLRLPAIAEAQDPLGRTEGAALWPERYPLETLRTIEDTLGSYSFASLYQQRPLPAGGRLFDTTKITVLETAPECTQTVRFYDLAVTARRSSDYTAGLKLGKLADETFVVLDVWRGQRELPDVHEAIVQNAAIDGPGTRIRLEAEKAGIVGLQFLLRDPRMHAYTVDAVPPEGDKYTRAGPVAARVNAGRLVLARGAWNRAFIDELATFPAGAHDDQVDALSGAYAMLSTKTRPMSVGVTKWL
jgi:predicted phage terminase large subunit-like protein